MNRWKKLTLSLLTGFIAVNIFAAETEGKIIFKSGEEAVSANLTQKDVYFANENGTVSVLMKNDGAVIKADGYSFTKNNSGMTLAKISSATFVIEKNHKETILQQGMIEEIATLQNPEELVASKLALEKKGTSLKFGFSSQPKSVRIFALSSPERIVFDFIGIKGKINAGADVRTANHPGGFRVVMEKRLPDYFSMKLNGESFELISDGKNQFASFKNNDSGVKDNKIVQTSKESNVSVSVKPEKKVELSSKEISGIVFVGENPEILRLSGASSMSFDKKIYKDKVELFVKDTFISKDKEQLIDAASLNGPVKEIAIFNENNGVKIVAAMNSADFDFIAEKNGTAQEFIFKSKKPKTGEAVAGFNEKVAVLASSATSQTMNAESSVDTDSEKRSYRGKKISLDFKDIDILDVLRLMSEISKLNIIAGDDVKGTITVRLVNIPWDEALDVILKSKSLGKERYGNIIRVAALKTIQQEKETELAKKKAQQKLEPVKVRLIAVNYARAAELMPQIKEILSDRGTISTDLRTNVLIVKDVEEVLDKTEKLIEYLDTQTPQVLIEAKIVEATSNATNGLGVQWGLNHYRDSGHGNPTGMIFPYNMAMGGAVNVPYAGGETGSLGFNFGSIGNITDLTLRLNVMESEGKVKIVSSPKVATLDNSEAMIQQGMSIPITTQGENNTITTKYIDATLILKTTPHITADGSILMNLSINKSEPDYSKQNSRGEPAILKKEAKTDVLIKSGDTVVIGGVYTNLTSFNKKGIPFLSEIPVLGWLFKSEDKKVERTELLIFLTPRIMNKVKSSIPLQKTEEE